MMSQTDGAQVQQVMGDRMYKRIVVPLDGSPFAERALEPAFDVARAFGAEIVLLRVVTPEDALGGLPTLSPRYVDLGGYGMQQEEAAASAYLVQAKARWSGQGVPMQTRVVAGAPAEAIVGAARDLDADLIVMSTHGRSAVGRILYGSVAEAVLRGAHLPVLLIPAARSDPRPSP
jgi:nucleotide-binding universal stress UspA family protein